MLASDPAAITFDMAMYCTSSARDRQHAVMQALLGSLRSGYLDVVVHQPHADIDADCQLRLLRRQRP